MNPSPKVLITVDLEQERVFVHGEDARESPLPERKKAIVRFCSANGAVVIAEDAEALKVAGAEIEDLEIETISLWGPFFSELSGGKSFLIHVRGKGFSFTDFRGSWAIGFFPSGQIQILGVGQSRCHD